MKKQNKVNQLIEKHTYFNQKFFAKWAKYYDVVAIFLKPLRILATKLLQLPSESAVLDTATGTGEQALALAKNSYRVTGIDLSPDMLQQAKKKYSPHLKLKFIQGDATKLPFPENHFDAATISYALHDMPYEIRIMVLREMKRVTKPEGKIAIIDYLEPKTGLFALAVHYIVRKFETPMYEDFLRRGLITHLTQVNLYPQCEKTFFGLGQIKICVNKK